MNIKKRFFVAIIIIVHACYSAYSFGAEIEGVSFDNTVKAGDAQLTLVGTGLLCYMIFIKAYVAAFYLEEGANSRDALSDIPKRLEIEYFHTIYAEDLPLQRIRSFRRTSSRK